MLDQFTNKNVIFGPPGTGKTTYLIDIVQQAVKDNIPVQNIGYFSFTKAATDEAEQRTRAVFPNINKKEFIYFRTLHSLCFSLLNLQKELVMKMDNSHGYKFCKMMGYKINPKIRADQEDTIQTKDDRLCLAEQKIRNLCCTPEEFFNDYDDREFTLEELKLYIEAYTKYKKTNGLYDFADMIERVSTENIFTPSFDVLIIDEAQDLSILQWKLVNKLMTTAAKTFVGGDDDQTIYTFAGANPNMLVSMSRSPEWNKIILQQSYRLPKLIQQVALNTLDKIPAEHRVIKTWAPKQDTGVVCNIRSISELDMSTGTWCIIARTNRLLHLEAKVLREMGLFFRQDNWTSVNTKHLEAIKLYEKLRSGKLVNLDQLDRLDNYIINWKKIREIIKTNFVKVDLFPTKIYQTIIDTPWYEAFKLGMTQNDIQYFRDILRKGDSLELSECRIFLSTMHAAKGREWDNVIVIYDISRATEKTYLKSPDEELRALYVAETRAKKNLYRMFPRSSVSYAFDI